MITLMKNKGTRRKIFIIISFLIFVRVGSLIPIPGVNADYMEALVSGSEFQFLNMIMGNSLSHMSLFALSIGPYITASIIIQLMTLLIPKLEELNKEGKTGQEIIQKVTNYTGIGIGFVQALFMAIGLGKKGLLDTYNWQTILFMTCVWTLGSAVLILLSEKISKFEMGNGVSYILLLNILSSFPFDVFRVQERLVNRENAFASVLFMIIAGVVFLLFIAVAVFLNLSEKRIPIKFSRKSISGGNNDHLPVPLNVCNVMPIIFTGSIFSMISILAAFSKSTILVTITRYLTQSNWFDIKNPIYTIGTILYVILVFFFANFYLDIAFNSDEIAYRLKQQGATVPGIRPGNPTSEYLRKNAKEMKTIGTVIVLILVLGSTLLCNVLNIGVLSIGGTSILIVVNVIIESSKKLKTVAQSVKSTSYYSRNKKGSLFRSKGVKNV